MKKCNCLTKISKSNKSLEELEKKMCKEHKKNFWKWIGNHPEI